MNQSIFNLPGELRKQLFEFIEAAYQLEKKLPLLPAQYRVRSEAREFDFVDLVQRNFGAKKNLRIVDLGAGSLDFLLDLKQILEPQGYELELHALDEAWRYDSDRERAAENRIVLHSARLPYLPIEGPFDIVTVNAPSGILFRELQPAIDGLSDQGFVVWRRSIGTMDGMLERNLLESLDENHYPYIYVSGRFKNLPDGSDTFPLPHLPVVIKKQGASFDPLIWTNEMVRQPSRSEARRAPIASTQIVPNREVKRVVAQGVVGHVFSVEFVMSMSRSEFRSFYDRFFPEMAALRQKNMRETALRKAGLALQVDEGLIVGADLTAREGFWEAAKLLFTGQKVAVLGSGASPVNNIRFFNDVPSAKKWLNAKKITAWVSPDEAVEHAELKHEVSDWVIMTNQRLAKLYSALGLEAFAQKLMISREFLRAA